MGYKTKCFFQSTFRITKTILKLELESYLAVFCFVDRHYSKYDLPAYGIRKRVHFGHRRNFISTCFNVTDCLPPSLFSS